MPCCRSMGGGGGRSVADSWSASLKAKALSCSASRALAYSLLKQRPVRFPSKCRGAGPDDGPWGAPPGSSALGRDPKLQGQRRLPARVFASNLAEPMKVHLHEPFSQIPMDQTSPGTTPVLGSERLYLLGSPFPPVLQCPPSSTTEDQAGVRLSGTHGDDGERKWSAGER